MSSEINAVSTKEAFAPVGPYSQGTIVTTSSQPPTPAMIYTSGQIPYTADGQRVTGSIGDQTAACLRNVSAILEAAGTSLDRAVKVTVFLTSMADFPEMNAEYEKWFGGPGGEGQKGMEKEKEMEKDGGGGGSGGHSSSGGSRVRPARSCVAVKELPLGVPVEIECVAVGPRA